MEDLRGRLIFCEVPFRNPADVEEAVDGAIIKALGVSPLLRIFYKPKESAKASVRNIGQSER